MLKTENERLKLMEHVLNDMRLEGLEPDAFGKALMERVIKGEITNLEAVHILNQHYKLPLVTKI